MKKIFIYICFTLFLFGTVESQIKTGYYFPPKGSPRSIIIVLANGMGVEQVSAALIANKGKLLMTSFPYSGYAIPWSDNNLTSDYLAGANILASGDTCQPGAMGIMKSGKVTKSLTEWANEKSMITGYVTNGSVTGAGSAFFIHSLDSKNPENTANAYLNSNIDILIGGGRKYFMTRSDKKNLAQSLIEKGYDYEDKIKRVGKIRRNKTFALIADDNLFGGKNSGEYLKDAVYNTANLLRNDLGFLMVVEDPAIGKASEANLLNQTASEIIDLDNALSEIYKLMGNDNETLILVIGNVSSGGLTLKSGSLTTGKVDGTWSNKTQSPTLVPVFASGPGADKFTGVNSYAEINRKLASFIVDRK